jgi:hypothetical protein
MKVILMVLTVLAIYGVLLTLLMKFANYGFHESVKLIRNVMMTLAGLSFIFSFQQQIKSKEDKIDSIIASFPDKMTKILSYINNNTVSSQLKEFILGGNDNNLQHLSIDDTNAIEFIIIEFYELWNKLIYLELMASSTDNYKKIFEADNKNQLKLFAPMNRVIGRLFSNEAIMNEIEKGSSFYPKGYIKYIKYCVDFYNRTKN